MKSIKNILLLFIVLSIALVFNGCKKPNNDNDDNGEDKKSYWDADGNGVPDWQEKEITLTFATWQYTDDTKVTIDVLMAEEFMTKYPNIKIEFVTAGEEYDYETNMLALHETNALPDVFLIRRLESFLPYNMLADLTEMYNNDQDTEAIFQSLQTSGIFNNKRYAIPTFIYPQFWVVNKTILAEKNIPIPNYDWTWDQMEAIAKAANDESQHIIGLYGRQAYYGEGVTSSTSTPYLFELPKILKMAQDRETGLNWAGWGYDGNKFNFSDNVFQEAINKMMSGLDAGWLKSALSAEQKLEYYGAEDYIPTTAGKVAVWREASWSFKGQKDDMTFEWDIYPGPSGVIGGNTDIAGISSLCQNKQAAYQFLKWMSYGEDGILSRFEIYKTSGSELFQQGNNYPYPIVDYGIDNQGINKIWSSIPYGDTAPGLVSSQFLESLRNGAYTLNKEVVGWDAVDYATADYFNQISDRTSTFAALRASIQNTADEQMQIMRESVIAAIG